MRLGIEVRKVEDMGEGEDGAHSHGNNQATASVAITPNNSTFSATHPPIHASRTIIAQSPRPVYLPILSLSPRSTPILLRIVSRPRSIHKLQVPSVIAHCRTRATLIPVSVGGSWANTPEGEFGTMAARGENDDEAGSVSLERERGGRR